jgi:hypothetical protein
LADPRAAGAVVDLLESAGMNGRANVIVTPSDSDFTVWGQDPFIAIRDERGATRLVQPKFFRPEGDDAVAGILARAMTIETERSPLCFHGGDILVGDDFVLVGRDCLETTLAELELATDAASHGSEPGQGAALFGALLGENRTIFFVGTDLPVPRFKMMPDDLGRLEVINRGVGKTQPLVHLDLYVSLAGRGESGRYRLLVGSPALADKILQRPPIEHSVAELFDDVASCLVEEGFEVIRNPLPITYADGRRKVDGVVRDVRLWYFATANNCLVQIDATEGDHVWLPTYGHGAWRELAATDEANLRIWEDLGFTVHQLTSYHAFAQRLGAVHCITKYLER